MSEIKKMQPKVRFKEFAGENAEAWEQRKLGEVMERVQGNDGRMNLPTLTISAGSGWLDQRERFSGNIAGNEQKNYTLLSKGQLSYNHGNSKLAKYGAVFELRTHDEALVPRVYHSFKCTEHSIPSFVEYMFATKIPDRELGKLVSSGARMDGLLNINFNDFSGIKVSLPKTEEQEKIGSFFRDIDNLITLHQRELENTKQLKRTMLSKMFPKEGTDVPEFRFAGFIDPWEQRKLGDVVTITMGQSPNGDTYSDVPSDHILVQGNADLVDGWVKPRIWTTQVTKTADAGDLIMSVRAPAGAMGKTAYNAVIGRGVAAIKGNEFIFQSLVRMDANGYWNKLSTGSTFASLNSKDIKEATILIPNKNEQAKIGVFFTNLDNLIALHQRELETCQTLKQTMLDKMFV